MTDPAWGVYWDLDNAMWCSFETLHGKQATEQARRRYRSGASVGFPTLDVDAVLDTVPTGGLRVHRAYAPWSATWTRKYAETLVNRGATLTEVGAATGLKNGADIQLALDVVDDVLGYGLTSVAVVSGDTDFAPLVVWCRRRGVRVQVVAAREGLSKRLRLVSDSYVELRSTPSASRSAEMAAQPGPPAPMPRAATREDPPAGARVTAPTSPTPLLDPDQVQAALRALQDIVPTGPTDHLPGRWVNRTMLSHVLRQHTEHGVSGVGFANWQELVESWGPTFQRLGSGAKLLVRRPAKAPISADAANPMASVVREAAGYLDDLVGQLQALGVSRCPSAEFDALVRAGVPELAMALTERTTVLGWADDHPAIQVRPDSVVIGEAPAYGAFVEDSFVMAVCRANPRRIADAWRAHRAGGDPWEGILSPGVGGLGPAAREVLWAALESWVRNPAMPWVEAGDVTLACSCVPTAHERTLGRLSVPGLTHGVGGADPPTLEAIAAAHVRRVLDGCVAPTELARAAAAITGPHPSAECAAAVDAALHATRA